MRTLQELVGEVCEVARLCTVTIMSHIGGVIVGWVDLVQHKVSCGEAFCGGCQRARQVPPGGHQDGHISEVGSSFGGLK